ncbi:MAG: flagellar protein FlaG [Chromatiales bacterium]|jgi:flagellar protein FlaG
MVSEVKNLQLAPISARDAPQANAKKQAEAVQKAEVRPAQSGAVDQEREGSVKTVADVVELRELDEAVSELNSVAQFLRRELQLAVDEQSGEVVVKVLDEQNDEVIRQIPSQEVLELRKSMEDMKGVIFKGSA